MQIIQTIQKELKKHIDLEYKKGANNFFKEPIELYGIRTPEVRRISRELYREVEDLSKTELFMLCEQLMKSGMQEEFLIGSAWAFRRRKELDKSDFDIFERWVNKYISNWATCDDFCTKSLGYLIYDFPELVPKIKTWTKSENQWVRRACAVSLIIPVRREKYLKDIFDVALDLLEHPEDMVQKGYGWMLKEAANIYLQEVFDFVIRHKTKMPRTALRYAIEKMPPAKKKQAMS